MEYLNSDKLARLASDPDTRLTRVTVRMHRCRFTAPAQDVSYLIETLEAAGDHCRDASVTGLARNA